MLSTFTVTQQANRPVGFIEVTDAASTPRPITISRAIASLPNKAKIVRNLVFHFDTVNSGSVVVDPGVRLGGGITMFGGMQSSTFDTAGTYGGGVFHGTAKADDSIFRVPRRKWAARSIWRWETARTSPESWAGIMEAR